MGHYAEFFKQFRTRFNTTGAIAPSSRFLGNSMVWPMAKGTAPRRILEVGPGTGAVTDRLLKNLEPGDRVDLVEINETFAETLRERFRDEKRWQAVADQCEIHVLPLQEFAAPEPYDFVISGLPMNNFTPELVDDLLETCFSLMKDGGVLSYFEYMYIRSIKCVASRGEEKKRIRAIDEVVSRWQDKYRFDRDWVFLNAPPAWVQHLRKPLAQAAAEEKPPATASTSG